MEQLFGREWWEHLKHYKSELEEIAIKVNNLRKKGHNIIPPKGSSLLFRAFKETPLSKVKCLVLGQDPYYSFENEHPIFDGLAFSNSASLHASPSLRNILEEVEADLGEGLDLKRTAKLSLYSWAEQGVLLINTAHTVEAYKPESHLHLWKEFTKEVFKIVNKKNDIVHLLWGAKAIKYKSLITNPSHAIICTSHPSPLSYTKSVQEYSPFKGSKCFSKTNYELEIRGKSKIIW